MSRNRTGDLAVVALLLAVAGCPDAGKTDGKGEAPVDSSTASTPTSKDAPKDPLAGSVFKKEDVLEVFFAEQAAGQDGTPEAAAERVRVLKKHRILDEEGREVPARARAYERALQALAQDEQAWSAEVEARGRGR